MHEDRSLGILKNEWCQRYGLSSARVARYRSCVADFTPREPCGSLLTHVCGCILHQALRRDTVMSTGGR
jgi:hypothetical protein